MSTEAAKKENRDVADFIARLQQRMTTDPQAPRRARYRAAFLAVRGQAEAGLRLGFTVKDVWQQLHDDGKVAMTYQTFRTHCRQAGLAPATGAGTRPGGPSGAADSSPRSSTRSFVHSATPDKKNLYDD